MVRFNSMWADAIDRPGSGKNPNRNIMTGLKTYLPIERNTGSSTTRSGKADIKKCLLSEIRTGNVGRKRRSRNNARSVEAHGSNDWPVQHRTATRVDENRNIA